MKSMTLHEVVRKLIGPIQPVGESNADEDRFRNLEATILLVDRLVFEISEAATAKDRPEASMKAIGKRADEFLHDLKDSL